MISRLASKFPENARWAMTRMARCEILDPDEVPIAHIYIRVCRRCLLLGVIRSPVRTWTTGRSGSKSSCNNSLPFSGSTRKKRGKGYFGEFWTASTCALLRGRPRGRVVDQIPVLSQVRSIQSSDPYGHPRVTEFRMTSSSFCEREALTRRSQ